MTLNEIIKIQSIIDNRSIAKDTEKNLKNIKYFSESKNKIISIGDMHIDHYVRSTNKQIKKLLKLNIDMAIELINLRKKERLLNEQ